MPRGIAAVRLFVAFHANRIDVMLAMRLGAGSLSAASPICLSPSSEAALFVFRSRRHACEAKRQSYFGIIYFIAKNGTRQESGPRNASSMLSVLLWPRSSARACQFRDARTYRSSLTRVISECSGQRMRACAKTRCKIAAPITRSRQQSNCCARY